MASGYVNLPAFRAPGPVDFSPISQGIDQLGRKIEQNRLLDQQKQIGAALQSGDYGVGANKAFEYGDLNTGLKLQGAQRDIENQKYTRQRQAAADQRAAARDSRTASSYADEQRSKLINRVAGIAQKIRGETDPERKAVMVQGLMGAHPKLAEQLNAYGFDAANPDPTFDMIIAEAQGLTKSNADDAVYGTTPQYYTDAEGNLRIGQMSNRGGFRPVEVPGTIQPTVQFQDTGTEIIPLSRQTGQQAAPAIAKDLRGAEREKEIGQKTGEAIVRQPQLEAQAEQMLQTMDNLLNDPYLPDMLGAVAGRAPNLTSDAARVQGKLNQLDAQVFLQGYERLKGGGVITDFEGQKAENALARIKDPRLSYDDYVQAVGELRAVVVGALERARGTARGEFGGQTDISAPATSVDALKQKYGLE